MYDPNTNAWSSIADLPNPTWGAEYSAANGQLLISGGVISGSELRPTLTNQGYAYSPATNAWSALPNADLTVYRGAGALGFYVAGGESSNQVLAPSISNVSVLPGYAGDASPIDIDWLSVSPQISDHRTRRKREGDGHRERGRTWASPRSPTTPRPSRSVPTPRTRRSPFRSPCTSARPGWGRIAGTVFGSDAQGNSGPLAGATVQIRSGADSYTLTTTAGGYLQPLASRQRSAGHRQRHQQRLPVHHHGRDRQEG